MNKRTVLAVIGRHKIGNWVIPQKIQSTICHTAASNMNEKISFIISEYQQSSGIPNLLKYLKLNKNNIKKIIFVSIFQLGKNKKEVLQNYNKIKKYNCLFFAETIYSKYKSIKQIKNFVKFIFNIKYYKK